MRKVEKKKRKHVTVSAKIYVVYGIKHFPSWLFGWKSGFGIK